MASILFDSSTQVPQRDGVWEPKVYDTSGNMYHVNDRESGDVMEDILVKGAKIRCMTQCVGLWIASGNLCQWKPTRTEADVLKQLVITHSSLTQMKKLRCSSIRQFLISTRNLHTFKGYNLNMLDDSDESEDEASPQRNQTGTEPSKKPKKKIVKKAKA